VGTLNLINKGGQWMGDLIFNTEPLSPSQKQKPKYSRLPKVMLDVIFYVTLVIAVAAAFFYSTNHSKVKFFFGYSYFTVLTTSMQSEIPKGSLIITKHVDSSIINIGDDITYLRSDGSTVTHRVVEIYNNYENSGARGFQTKGIDNPEADENIVYAANVVGVVIFSVANLGSVLSYIANNLWFVFVMFGILLILSFSLKVFFGVKKLKK